MTHTREAAAGDRRPRGGISRLRPSSITFLSYGFRPFFFGAALWAATAMALWIGLLSGLFSFATRYGVVAWHAHEFLLGYVAAVVTGFLLTAIPNWTARLPVQGAPLLALFSLWVAGRLALLASDAIGPATAAAIDGAYLFVLAVVILREIVAGQNWRNLPVAGLVLMLGTGNVLFHIEVLTKGFSEYGMRAAAAAIVGMIMLIGGRITPSFTRNWLVRQRSERLPAPFGRLDRLALAIAAAALIAWTVMPGHAFTGGLLALAALAQATRLARWAGTRTWREPLVLILHAGYAFVPFGFATLAVATLRPVILNPSDAFHAWTVGAVGVMTLAVMTRATLGHTGRALCANAATSAIYLCILLAAATRIGANFVADPMQALTLSATAWILAFLLFALTYGPMLLTAKRSA